MKAHICPKCKHDGPRRVERQGFLQRRVYTFFGYYPWECTICRAFFYLRSRGQGYLKRVRRNRSESSKHYNTRHETSEKPGSRTGTE